MNKKINKTLGACVVCGLAASIIFQTTPYCHECHKNKHEHLPEENFVRMEGSTFNASGISITANTIITLEDFPSGGINYWK